MTDPALLQINIVISRQVDAEGQAGSQMAAFLKDKAGRPVANPKIQVKANGIPLTLNGGSTNYYGAFPHYELRDSTLPVNGAAEYAFSVVLTDGLERQLGRIRTQADPKPSQFAPPAAHSRQKALTLHWQGLAIRHYFLNRWKSWFDEGAQTELKLSKSWVEANEWGYPVEESGSPDAADYLSRTIESGDGSLVIPLAFFQGPLRRFNRLNVLLTSTEQVKIKGGFLAGSFITSTRNKLYYIEIK